MLSTDRVRKLYADAVQYDETHARRDLNEAEFRDWLAAHDEETKAATVTAFVHVLKSVPDGMFWNRDHPSTDVVKAHVKLMLDNAEALGVKVDRSILEKW